MVVVINSSPMTNSLLRNFTFPTNAPLPKNGLLEVRMFSNQNFSSIASDPLKRSVPVAGFPMQVTAINSSVLSAEPGALQTDGDGFGLLMLLPGSYLLQAKYQTLNIEIP